MSAKCKFCEWWGKTPHCGNCKINTSGKVTLRDPHAINESIEEFIYNVENNDISNMYSVGDYIKFDTPAGELVAYIAGFNHDYLAQDDGTATVSLLVHQTLIGGRFSKESYQTPELWWEESEIRNKTMPMLFSTLPECLREHIVPIRKQCIKNCMLEGVIEVEDKLWLLSANERGYNRTTWGEVSGEGEQYEIFSEPRLHQGLTWAQSDGCTSLRTPVPYHRATFAVDHDQITRRASCNFYEFTFGFCLTRKIQEDEEATIQ